MKRLIISMMVTVMFLIGCGGCESASAEDSTHIAKEKANIEVGEKPHFRQAYWGSSMQEVKATLTDKDEIAESDASTLVIKNSEVSDYVIGYWFVDDKLTHGVYMYDKEHYNKNKYIDEYGVMKSILTEKYGVPEYVPGYDEWIWKDDLYRDDPQDYGMAVSLGHLVGAAEWDVTSGFYNIKPKSDKDSQPIITDILLIIMGDNFEISIGVSYQSREFYHLFEEKEKKQNEENF